MSKNPLSNRKAACIKWKGFRYGIIRKNGNAHHKHCLLYTSEQDKCKAQCDDIYGAYIWRAYGGNRSYQYLKAEMCIRDSYSIILYHRNHMEGRIMLFAYETERLLLKIIKPDQADAVLDFYMRDKELFRCV